MAKIDYPDAFQEKVKALFPDESTAKWLRDGNAYIGRKLSEASVESLTPEEVSSAILNNETTPLLIKAERIIQCKELYEEWQGIHEGHLQKNPNTGRFAK